MPAKKLGNEHTLSVPELAEIMGRSQQYVRLSIERKELPVGYCIYGKKGTKNKSYCISKKLVEDFLGDITDKLNDIRNR